MLGSYFNITVVVIISDEGKLKEFIASQHTFTE